MTTRMGDVEWGNYYKNLTEHDIREAVAIGAQHMTRGPRLGQAPCCSIEVGWGRAPGGVGWAAGLAACSWGGAWVSGRGVPPVPPPPVVPPQRVSSSLSLERRWEGSLSTTNHNHNTT